MDIVNSFEIDNEKLYYYDITKITNSSKKLKNLPIVLKILLEANLRKAKDAIEFNKIVNIFSNRMNSQINFYPSRIIMKDFTGIPTLIELASVRDYLKNQNKEVDKINPQIMFDLVLDDTIDLYSNDEKNQEVNISKEHDFNKQRYEFVKWAQGVFSNFRVVPPGSGICHQVNLEYLSTILHVEKQDDSFILYPETIVATDSKTAMINSLGVLGWGIEQTQAQATVLGLPISLNLPKVVGVNITGKLKEGINSSDLVFTLTKLLKEHNVSGKLVEFYGEGLKYLTLEDRSIISNLAPEYEAISSFFAIDDKTISYFENTRDSEDYSKLIKTYLQKQGLFYNNEVLDYDEIVNLDLSILEPIILGPKRVQDRVDISSLKKSIILNSTDEVKDLDIVFSAITSCELNSNPYLLIHASLVAKKALEFGLKIDKNIKTFFDPGLLLVKDYLEKLGLLHYLEDIGFNITAYGCPTSYNDFINLDVNIESDIKNNNLNVCSVSSGQKNFDKRVHPLIKSNYLMTPSLVLIYSLIGTMKYDLLEDVIGVIDDKDIYLKDLWPSSKIVGEYLQELDSILYKEIYKDIFKGNESWRKLIVDKNSTYTWNTNSNVIQPSKFYEEMTLEKIEINKAGVLALLGDSISSEYLSGRGQIALYSPCAKYLESKGVKSYEYFTFESRYTNAQVMKRATLDNSRLQNLMVSKEGSYTMDYELNEIVSIYEKAESFKEQNRDFVILAGADFGVGVSRTWASKGIKLLGVKTIIAKSFDEEYRKNLITYGVLPLEFIDDDIQSLKLKGHENITILCEEIKADSKILVTIHKKDVDIEIELKCRLDNELEVKHYKNGGTLSYLLKNIQES